MPRVVHFEIHAKDQDKLQKFYEEVFSWEVQKMGQDFGGYRVLMTGKEPIGINGGMNHVPSHTPKDGEPVNAFVCIIGVNEIAPYPEKVKAAGGTVVEEIMEIPTIGKLCYCKDPEGNMFGIIQPVGM